MQDPVIDAAAEGVFEHHAGAAPPFTLLRWRPVPG